jgi:hypothetical protein
LFTGATSISGLMPHGFCLLWRPGLMALHVISDALIAAAYFAIPLGIAVFVAKRRDLNDQHRLLALLFAVFITACGMTHLMAIVVLWQPDYVLDGLIKALTAVVSLVTAVMLPFLISQLLRIPSPETLAAEIAAHRRTLAELQAARAQLAERFEATEGDLRETTRRFEAALHDSPVTLYEQDSSLHYTWMYNPPFALAADSKSEMDFFSPETGQALRALKREALATGTSRRAQIRLALKNQQGGSTCGSSRWRCATAGRGWSPPRPTSPP